MGVTSDGRFAWTFDIPTAGTRVYCYEPEGLVLYDAHNDSAYIAAEHPCNLHDWR